MITRTTRLSPDAESPHTTLDHLAALTSSRISSGRLRIPCPAHGGTNPTLALWVGDDGIGAKCHSADCSYDAIATAIKTAYGISIAHSYRREGPKLSAHIAVACSIANLEGRYNGHSPMLGMALDVDTVNADPTGIPLLRLGAPPAISGLLFWMRNSQN